MKIVSNHVYFIYSRLNIYSLKIILFPMKLLIESIYHHFINYESFITNEIFHNFPFERK